ncbi:hypothetical protein Avbf_04148 [Armadillidium vulgare]|nr:hypothetical protein Avbf_04148 [Armadillidium vulgare]
MTGLPGWIIKRIGQKCPGEFMTVFYSVIFFRIFALRSNSIKNIYILKSSTNRLQKGETKKSSVEQLAKVSLLTPQSEQKRFCPYPRSYTHPITNILIY